jgi:hypothetical protein
MRPFEIVEDCGFQCLMKTGQPAYYIPHEPQSHEMSSRCSQTLRNALQRCLLTTIALLTFICFFSHIMDFQFQHLLCLCNIPDYSRLHRTLSVIYRYFGDVIIQSLYIFPLESLSVFSHWTLLLLSLTHTDTFITA